MNHRSGNRCATPSSSRQMGRAQGAGFSKTKLESRGESMNERQRPFLEDFNMEHSFSGVTVTLISVSGSDPKETGSPRNPYAHSMTSPNCVYLG